jgi:TonB family protein
MKFQRPRFSRISFTIFIWFGYLALGISLPAQTTIYINSPFKPPITVGRKAQESKLIEKVDPVYPQKALDKGIKGNVILHAIINEEGLVWDAEVINSANPVFNEPAIAALEQWRYSPTLVDRKPVPISTTVIIPIASGETGTSAREHMERFRLMYGPMRVGNNFMKTRLIVKVDAEYPEQLKQEGIEGKIILNVYIDEKGAIEEVLPVTWNYEAFEEAAIAAVKQWRFSPAPLSDGRAVPVLTSIPFSFTMNDKSDLSVSINEFGDLNPEMGEIKKAQGKIRINITKSTSYQVIERVIRDLIYNGVQRIQLSDDYVLYQAQPYYAPLLSEALLSDTDYCRFTELAIASGRLEKGKKYRISYRLYFNRAGEIIGIEKLAGPKIDEVEKELIHLHQQPVVIDGTAVPSMKTIGWFFIG